MCKDRQHTSRPQIQHNRVKTPLAKLTSTIAKGPLHRRRTMDATGPPITDAIGDQTKNRPPSSLARQEPTRRYQKRPGDKRTQAPTNCCCRCCHQCLDALEEAVVHFTPLF
uniref:Uncharacterized protein n=1 Tax=Encephalitozoon cuniculi TaxID=6035 RepID=M1KMR0_ENCCN|nr:hypothetical protein ECU01_0040 [Encephalitozoon cuniculi]